MWMKEYKDSFNIELAKIANIMNITTIKKLDKN